MTAIFFNFVQGIPPKDVFENLYQFLKEPISA